LRTAKAYVYQNSVPLFGTEPDAQAYLRQYYGAIIDLSRNDALSERRFE
jgi:hypothetical protein